jgi:hypothetical protein
MISFSFHSGDQPPSVAQVTFFRQLEAKFPQLWSQLRATLTADIDEFFSRFTSDQYFESLTVNAITLWDLSEEPYQWEISCTTPLDHHVLGIEMGGFENQGFRIDV